MQSLINKHQEILKISFFPSPKTVSEALYFAELGWFTILGGVVDEITPEFCKSAFARALSENVQYHRQNCGQRNYSGERLGCQGKCEISLENYKTQGMSTLTEEEAVLLSKLLNLDLDENDELWDKPYTPDNLNLA